jgi:hypothetical protein
MRKRTFVLFFCLIQSMAFVLFPQHTQASCKLDVGMSGFSPYSVEASESEDQFVLIDESIERKETIVRADDFEWKETLSHLLRHRPSTYRFLTEVCQPANTNERTTQVSKLIREHIYIPAVTRGAILLPSYYGYLHLLCPF